MNDIDVFVTRRFPGGGIGLLEKSGLRVEIFGRDGEGAPGEEILKRAPFVRGLLTMLSDRVDAKLLDAAPKLRAVANYAVGFDNIDVAAATARKVAVTNTPGVLTNATAELAISLLFAAARRIPESDAYVREGRFRAWAPDLMLGVEIAGKTLGILGMGRIGKAVALKAAGLGMKVAWCDCDRGAPSAGAPGLPLPLERLLAESDFVSLHVPLTPDTKGMINAERLASMKEGSILINTSRGPVVDEKALVEALKNGPLRAAGLDVYEREPEVEPGLLKLPNVVLAPHIGSATIEARSAMGMKAAKNLLDALEGRRPEDLVNPEAWPPAK